MTVSLREIVHLVVRKLISSLENEIKKTIGNSTMEAEVMDTIESLSLRKKNSPVKCLGVLTPSPIFVVLFTATSQPAASVLFCIVLFCEHAAPLLYI